MICALCFVNIYNYHVGTFSYDSVHYHNLLSIKYALSRNKFFYEQDSRFVCIGNTICDILFINVIGLKWQT